MSARRKQSSESPIPHNPQIPIVLFDLQTAFRARMKIFKSGISGSAGDDCRNKRCDVLVFLGCYDVTLKLRTTCDENAGQLATTSNENFSQFNLTAYT